MKEFKRTKQDKLLKRKGFDRELLNFSSILSDIKHNWVDIGELPRKIASKLNIKSKGIR